MSAISNKSAYTVASVQVTADGASQTLVSTALTADQINEATSVLFAPKSNPCYLSPDGKNASLSTTPRLTVTADTDREIAGQGNVRNMTFSATASTVIDIFLFSINPN